MNTKQVKAVRRTLAQLKKDGDGLTRWKQLGVGEKAVKKMRKTFNLK